MRYHYQSGQQPLRGYTIQRGVGQGGFGEVYLGISDAGKQVALKLLQRNLQIELRGVTQCLNLKHPNLVSLFDIVQSSDGDYWVIMEYMASGTLDQLLKQYPQGLPPDLAVAWLRGIAAGVAYLHEHDIVHRDLKPANFFVENGTARIGDYGLSKFASDGKRSGQTRSIGTVYYMAPEIATGRYGKEIDLYALGCIFYEMLTGKLPFDGETPGEVLMKHLTASPNLSVLPEEYQPIIGRLLEKDPAQRYPSVAEFAADLEFAVPEEIWQQSSAPIPNLPAALPETVVQPQFHAAPKRKGWFSGSDDERDVFERDVFHQPIGSDYNSWSFIAVVVTLALVCGFFGLGFAIFFADPATATTVSTVVTGESRSGNQANEPSAAPAPKNSSTGKSHRGDSGQVKGKTNP